MKKKIKTSDVQTMKVQLAELTFKEANEVSAKVAVAQMTKEINAALKKGHSITDVCDIFNTIADTNLNIATFRTYWNQASHKRPKRKTSRNTAITIQSRVNVNNIETKNATTAPDNTELVSDEIAAGSTTPAIIRDDDPRTANMQSSVAEPRSALTPQTSTTDTQIETASHNTDGDHTKPNDDHHAPKANYGKSSGDFLEETKANKVTAPTINLEVSTEATA